MAGAGVLIALAGLVSLWAGYVDANVLEVIDAAVSRKELPPHKAGQGVEKVAIAGLTVFALTKSTDFISKIAEGLGIGAAAKAAGKAGETPPVETPPIEIPAVI